MNQVPEIKEGLQFTVEVVYRPNIIYTLVQDGEDWMVKWEGTDCIYPYPHYPIGLVKAMFEKGNWKVYTPPAFPLSTLFSSQPENVLMTALEECAKDHQTHLHQITGLDEYEGAYTDFLTFPPETIVEKLVGKIHQLGFTIVPK